MSVTEEGALELYNPRHEAFANILADGSTSQWRAWGLTSSDPMHRNPDVLKVSASRVACRRDVRARVRWLRMEERRADRSPDTALSLSSLFAEVTTTLSEAYNLAERAGAGSSKLSKIRKLITTHVGRVERSSVQASEPELNVEESHKIDVTNVLNIFRYCSCANG